MIDNAEKFFDSFTPINNSLNLGKTYRSLEDAAFHILEPLIYEELEGQLQPMQKGDGECLRMMKKAAGHLLTRNNIRGSVQGRLKSLYSIHCKMARKGVSLDNIQDRIGLRIIVASVAECYQVLGLLHAHFPPVAGTLEDYIGQPKDNGYQSLHTCVYPLQDIPDKIIEFQIRTELMHKEAEFGNAAHWKYKQQGTLPGLKKCPNSPSQQHDTPPKKNTEAFIELLAQKVAENHIVIFSKGGRKIRLPANTSVAHFLQATDMAASATTEIKVNEKKVGFDHILQDGDTIEVLASRQGVEKNTAPQNRYQLQVMISRPADLRRPRWSPHPTLAAHRLSSLENKAKRPCLSRRQTGCAIASPQRDFGLNISSPETMQAANLLIQDFKKKRMQ